MYDPTFPTDRELVLTRIFDAPRAKVWRAWTDPELLVRWWAPRPFTTPVCDMDLRPGGVFRTVMRDADGNDYPNPGIFLDIVENERIVFTDAFSEGWMPAGQPFMVATVTLEDLGGRTRYTARARHWTAEACEAHARMGFHDGWGQCADQLADLLATL